MVMKKKYTRLSRSARRKYGKRKQYINRKGQNIHLFKRTVLQTVAITNAGFVGAQTLFGTLGIEHQLDSLPNYSDFTNMYDSYKICGIKKKFVFNRNNADVQLTTAGAELPMLLTVNDFNDKTDPANENAMLEYASFKQARLDRPVKRYFRPSILLGDGTSTTSNSVKSRWLSTADADAEHFGLKWAVNTVSTATGATIGTLKVYTTYYIACRTPR